MDEKQFFNGMSEFRIGKEVSMPVEGETEEEPGKPVQTAGLGSSLGRLLGRSSRNILSKQASKAPELPTTSIEEIEAAVNTTLPTEGSERIINEANLGQILNGMESQEDVTRLLDLSSIAESKYTKQTFEEIEASSDIVADLAPVFKNQQKGLLTAKQQFGLRTLATSTGDKAMNLAQQIAGGDHTPELLLEYRRTVAIFESLYRTAKGNARETARALNQQKMLSKVLNNKNLREMGDALQLYGNSPDGDGIIASAKVVAGRLQRKGPWSKQKGSASIEALSYLLSKDLNTYTRGAVELWKNSILSGLGTHTVNLASVAAVNLWENLAIRPVATGVGAVRRAGTRYIYGGSPAPGQPVPPGAAPAGVPGTGTPPAPEDGFRAAEMIYQQAGAMVGFRSSFRLFVDAFMSGESKFGIGNKMEETGAIREIAGGTFADISTVSFRLLRAEDDAMRGIVFTSELYALAAREGRNLGHTGKELLEYVNKTIDDPADTMYDEAMKEASRKTFTEGDLKGAVGMMAKYTKAVVGEVPALQFILPFINTPANLLQYGMDSSILAAVSPRLWKEVAQGGAKADMALAKISTGSSLTIGIWQLYEAGIISGNGPKDPAARAQLEMEGWKPNAIKAPNGKWYQIKRMEPLSTTLGFVANALDKAKYAPSDQVAKEYMAHAMLSVAETAMDSAWTAGIYDFYEAVGDVGKWDKFAANFGASFVPYSGAVKSLEQITDPTARLASDDPLVNRSVYDLTISKARSNIPFISKTIRPARYWDGTVRVPDQGGFAFAMSPIKIGTKGEGNIVNRELISNRVNLREPSPIMRFGPIEVSLLDITGGSDGLYDQYIVAIGKARAELLSKAITKGSYAKLTEGPNGERYAILQKMAMAAKRKGTIDFLKGDMLTRLEKDPDSYKRAELMFRADPIAMIKSLAKFSTKEIEKVLQLNVRKRLSVTRGTVELPDEESSGIPYLPRF